MSQVDDATAQRELNVTLERFRGEPRAALGLAAGDDAGAARRSFMALCKVYHPAKFARFAPPTVKLSNEVFLAIRRAYETVTGTNGAPSPRALGSGPPLSSRAITVVTTPDRPATRMPRHHATPPGGVPIPTPGSRAPGAPNLTPSTGMPRVAPPASAATAPAAAPPAPVSPSTSTTARIGSLGGRTASHPAAPPPRDETAMFEAALEHTRRQRWAEARSAFGELAAQYPGMPRYRAYLHYTRGWEAFGLGKQGEAKAEWQRAQAADPTNGLPRWALETTGLG